MTPFYLVKKNGERVLVKRRDGVFVIDIPPSQAVNWPEFTRIYRGITSGFQVLCDRGVLDAKLFAEYKLKELVVHGSARVVNSSVLFEMPTLRELSVEGSCDFDDLSSVKYCSFDRIYLNNQSSRTGKPFFDALVTNCGIKELSISRIDLVDLRPLVNLTQLSRFVVNSGSIHSSNGLASLTRLQHLDLYGTNFYLNSDINCLADLRELFVPELRALMLLPASIEKVITTCKREPLDLSLLSRLEQLKDLRVGACSNCSIEQLVAHPALISCRLPREYKKRILDYRGSRNNSKKLTIHVGREQFQLCADGRFALLKPITHMGPSLVELIEQNRKDGLSDNL